MLEEKKPKKEDHEIASGGLSFLQHADLVPGTDGELHDEIDCYNCKRRSHYSNKCPTKNVKSGVSTLQLNDEEDVEYDIMFAQVRKGSSAIPK